MATFSQSTALRRFSFWRPVWRYGIPLFLIYGLAAFLVEQYSGSCMFVLPIYFYALVTTLGVLKEDHFGTGLAIFFPFALLGPVMDYYGDWVYDRNLINPWYALGWAPVFLAFGLAADLAHSYAPAGWHPRWRAVSLGVIFGLVFFVLVLLALSLLYPRSDEEWHLWYFREGAFFSLPWMLINGGFAGYSAYAITRRV